MAHFSVDGAAQFSTVVDNTKQLMKCVKWFKENRIKAYNESELASIEKNVISMSNGLYSAYAIRSCLSERQQSWFNKNWFKCSVAMITYEWIRCEGVHNIYPEPFHFGKGYPKINYQLLKKALDSLVSYLNKQCKQDKDLFAQFN